MTLILAGLGFKQEDFQKPAREYSGGWVMRAHLAQLLVMEAARPAFPTTRTTSSFPSLRGSFQMVQKHSVWPVFHTRWSPANTNFALRKISATTG